MSEQITNSVPLVTKHHRFFLLIDRPYAIFLSKIGLKYFSQQVDFSHPDFFANVYRRWAFGWGVSLILGWVAYQLTMRAIWADALPLDQISYLGIVHALIGFVSLMAFQIFRISGRFIKGKEQKRGRYSIGITHTIKILLLPTLWALVIFFYWFILPILLSWIMRGLFLG